MQIARMEMDCNLKTLLWWLQGFFLFSWNNVQKLVMVCSPFDEIIRFFSFDVLGAFYSHTLANTPLC